MGLARTMTFTIPIILNMNKKQFDKPKGKLRRHDGRIILDMTVTGCSYILTEKNTISVFVSVKM